MIRFRGVSRSYGQNVAVKRLDLEVRPGELFALLGHNGAGKTTTIKMMVGLLRPGGGTVEIDGCDVAADPLAASQRVGYVPDQPYLYEKLSGREFLEFVAQMHGLDAAKSRDAIARETDRFGLTRFLDDLSESYSHGMKQRTVFAAALLHDPRLLVVDEPLVGLDPHSIRLAKDLFRARARSGRTVFMSTHTLAVAEEIADRIGVMNRGELIFEGTIDELRERHDAQGQSLEAIYLSMVGSDGGRDAPSAAAE
ncbi:MAG: ABC transporter ATP-binding protein [Lacipirellulaceae bacterium]